MFREALTENLSDMLIISQLQKLGFKRTKGLLGLDIYEDKYENKVFLDTETYKIEDIDIADKKLLKKVQAL